MTKGWPILVVDDEEVMCESMAAWLREDGYRTHFHCKCESATGFQ
jgi:CheY-like chemotaxis protein